MARITDAIRRIGLLAVAGLALQGGAVNAAEPSRHYILAVSDARDFFWAFDEHGRPVRNGGRGAALADALTAYLTGSEMTGDMPPFRPGEDTLTLVFASEPWSDVGRQFGERSPECAGRFNRGRELGQVFHDAETMPRTVGSAGNLKSWLARAFTDRCNGLAAAIPVTEYAKFALPMVAKALEAAGRNYPYDQTYLLAVENFSRSPDLIRFDSLFGQVTFGSMGRNQLAAELDAISDLPLVVRRGVANGRMTPMPRQGDDYPMGIATMMVVAKQPKASASFDPKATQTLSVADPRRDRIYWQLLRPQAAAVLLDGAPEFQATTLEIAFIGEPDGKAVTRTVTLWGGCAAPVCLDDGKRVAPFAELPLPVLLKRGSELQVQIRGWRRSALYDYLPFEQKLSAQVTPPYTHRIEPYHGPAWFLLGTSLSKRDVLSATPIELNDDTLLRMTQQLDADGLVTADRIGREIEWARFASTFSVIAPVGILIMALLGWLLFRRLDKVRIVTAEQDSGFVAGQLRQGDFLAVGRFKLTRVPGSHCKVRATVVTVEIPGCEVSVAAVSVTIASDLSPSLSHSDYMVDAGSAFVVWINLSAIRLSAAPEAPLQRGSITHKVKIGVDFARIWKEGDEAPPPRPAWIETSFAHEAKPPKDPSVVFEPLGCDERGVAVYRRDPGVARNRVTVGSAKVFSTDHATDIVQMLKGTIRCVEVRVRTGDNGQQTVLTDGTLIVAATPVSVVPGQPGLAEITLDLRDRALTPPNRQISFILEFQLESGKLFRSEPCLLRLEEAVSHYPPPPMPPGPQDAPGFTTTMTPMRNGLTGVVMAHDRNGYSLNGEPHGDFTPPPLTMSLPVARGANPTEIFDLQLSLDATDRQVREGKIHCKVRSDIARSDNARIEYTEGKDGACHRLLSFTSPTFGQELILPVAAGYPTLARVSFNNRLIDRILPGAAPVRVRATIELTAEFERQGFVHSTPLFRQEAELVLSMDIALPFLAVDFGTSAIAVAHGPGKAARLLELGKLVEGINPAHNLIDYDVRAKAGGPFFMESSLFCRSDDFVEVGESYPASYPGYPASRGRTTAIGTAEFIELPVTAHRALSWKEYLAKRYITGIKGWLGVMSNRIDLDNEISLRPEGLSMEIRTKALPLQQLLQSAFAALFQAYVLRRKGLDEFGRVVISHPNTFTPEQREMLRQCAATALATATGERWDEGERVLLAKESECVLMRYLDLEHRNGLTFHARKVMVYDLGAGTLDVTIAEAGWVVGDSAANAKQPEITIGASVAVNVAGHDLDEILTRLIDEKMAEYIRDIPRIDYQSPIQNGGIRPEGMYEAFLQFWTNLQAAKKEFSKEYNSQGGYPPFLAIRFDPSTMTRNTPENIAALVDEGLLTSVDSLYDRPEITGPVAMNGPDGKPALHVRIATGELQSYPLYREFIYFVTHMVVESAMRMAGLDSLANVEIVPAGRGALWPEIWTNLRNCFGSTRFKADLLHDDESAKGSVALGAIEWADWYAKLCWTPPEDDAHYVIRIDHRVLLWDPEGDWKQGYDCTGNKTIEVLTTNLSEAVYREMGLTPTSRFFTTIGEERGLTGVVCFDLDGPDVTKKPFAITAVTPNSRRVLVSLASRAGAAEVAKPRWPMGQSTLPSVPKPYR